MKLLELVKKANCGTKVELKDKINSWLWEAKPHYEMLKIVKEDINLANAKVNSIVVGRDNILTIYVEVK